MNEIWTTLSGDGSKGPFYVRTKDPGLAASNLFSDEIDAHLAYVPIIHDSNKRDIAPAERGMLAYLFYMVYVAGYLKKGDILLFDGEASFRTPGVKQLMAECGIVPLVIEPSCLHQLLSPCDNHFHSILKLSYYRLLSNENLSSISEEEKLKLAYQCYHAVDESSVVSMFRKCGLLPSEDDSATVVTKLMSEGIGSIGKSAMHRRNLLKFLNWCRASGNISCCSGITEKLLRSVGLF